MTLLDRIKGFIEDPPPAYIFELSQEGVAWSSGGNRGFQPLPEGILRVNPLGDNVLDSEALTNEIRRIAPQEPGKIKRRPCALILPDYSARLTVLDFDSLPSDLKEQASLIRFRVKKSLPFDVDTAALSFQAQPTDDGKQEAIVAAVSHEILSRYEAAFRAAGFHPGYVTISALASVELLGSPDAITVAARLNQRVLTILVLSKKNVSLARCVELAAPTIEETSDVLIPTLSYVEDKFGTIVSSIRCCGFEALGDNWKQDLNLTVEPFQSSLGMPTGQNAGLLGYLQSMGATA